jgi:hypothetical protein
MCTAGPLHEQTTPERGVLGAIEIAPDTAIGTANKTGSFRRRKATRGGMKLTGR